MQDGDIAPIEFHKLLQEVQRYCKLKANVRNQAKPKVKEITKEKARKIFYKKSQTLQVPRVPMPFKI